MTLVVVIFSGMAGPLSVRAAICAAALWCLIDCGRRSVLLTHRDSIRALEWTLAGEWFVRMGKPQRWVSAKLGSGSFRLGNWLLALRFETPEGAGWVLMEGPVQDFAGLCRLCRQLEGSATRASGRPPRAS